MSVKLIDIALYQEEGDEGITVDFLFEDEDVEGSMGSITFCIGDTIESVGQALSLTGEAWAKKGKD